MLNALKSYNPSPIRGLQHDHYTLAVKELRHSIYFVGAASVDIFQLLLINKRRNYEPIPRLIEEWMAIEDPLRNDSVLAENLYYIRVYLL